MRTIRNWTIRRRLLSAFLGLLIPFLALAGIAGMGLRTIWLSVMEMYDVATIKQQMLSDVESSLDRLDDALRDFGRAETPVEGVELAQSVAQLHVAVARIQPGLFDHSGERTLLAAIKSRGGQIESLSQKIIRGARLAGTASTVGKLEVIRRHVNDASAILNQAQAIVLREMKEDRQRVSRTIKRILALGLATFILSGGGGVILALTLSTSLSRPVLAIVEKSRRMAEGDLSQRINIQAGGELGEAARAFNEMAERLEASTGEVARLYEEVRRYATELEGRVRERTAELEEALRVKAQFLANMSHELRTPLNFILGFSDLLQRGTGGALTPKQAHYVENIQRGGKWLFELVGNILDLSLAGGGANGLRLEAVPLAPLIQEILDMVTVQAEHRRLELITHLDPRLAVVVADRRKLAQIVANLVMNAVKFTPEGGTVRVTARHVERPADRTAGSSQPLDGSTGEGESVEITVEDTGIGIRPEHLHLIFRGFTQVDASDTRKYGGAGLGLALVRRLVDLHGGRVWAESAALGRGARFVVRLPRLTVPRPKHILMVENEAVTRDALSTALEQVGYLVERASTGAAALAALASQSLDLLILDIVLPDVEGWEVLRQVRGQKQTRDLPVLVLTGLESVQADEALARGADEFLAKPISAQVLGETVGRLLRPTPATKVTE